MELGSNLGSKPLMIENNDVIRSAQDQVCKIAVFCIYHLTSSQTGVALIYHLRSNSGSNGPIAKECHRFLVAGPF